VKIWGRTAEIRHFSLLIDPLAGPKNMREASHTYYVCTVCGYTSSEPVTGNCVSCASPAEEYEAVELAD